MSKCIYLSDIKELWEKLITVELPVDCRAVETDCRYQADWDHSTWQLNGEVQDAKVWYILLLCDTDNQDVIMG